MAQRMRACSVRGSRVQAVAVGVVLGVMASAGLAACAAVDGTTGADSAADTQSETVTDAPSAEVPAAVVDTDAALDSNGPAADAAADAAVDATPSDVLDLTKYTGKCKGGPTVCDDANPCTVDDCDALIGCTHVGKSCADADVCTLDACDLQTGTCLHAADACDDHNACTQGACAPGEGCIFAALACEDGDKCTVNGCTPAVGCSTALLGCDDGVQCTADSCDPAVGCVNVAPAGPKCCKLATDCEDADPCTTHACNAGVCQDQTIWKCCLKAAECDDGNACTNDLCNPTTHGCYFEAVSVGGCCKADSDCDDAKGCTLDRCVSQQCGHEPICCLGAKDCVAPGAVDPCEAPTCTAAGCALPPQPDACCQPGTATVAWPTPLQLDPAVKGTFSIADAGKFDATKAGTTVLLYEATPISLQPGLGVVARARLTVPKLPAGAVVTLQFAARVQLPGGEYLRLRAKTSVGQWTLWQSSSVPSWQTLKLNLTGLAARAATRAVQLSFEIQPNSGIAGSHYAMIGAPTLTVGCTAPTCSIAAQCNDGLAATLDICADATCVYKTNPEYCESTTMCDDKNVCTSDSCNTVTVLCLHNKIANCCLQSSDCDDKNVCTFDQCAANKCTYAKKPAAECCNVKKDCDDLNVCTEDSCPVVGLGCAHTQADANCCMGPKDCDDSDTCSIDLCKSNQCQHQNQCCTSAADCDDGEPVCTLDLCGGDGKCTWKAVDAPGCCVPQVFAHDVEAGVPGGWAFVNGPTAVKWQWVTGKQAHMGKGALWYGNPATNNFDDGAPNKGSVVTAPLGLPNGETLEFAFWLWMDTEGGLPYDGFEVRVKVDSKSYKLWDKGLPVATGLPMVMKTWNQVRVPLSAFAGKTVTIELAFDSIDQVANNTQGVYLDDFSLVRSCGPGLCAKATDCDDNLALTTDQCVSGKCTWTVPP
ncbi:MAG: hypothetical protein EXR79_05970 [Myxococcales bacterium]|nr:hypothetical protein [Myxococcales bacterium]